MSDNERTRVAVLGTLAEFHTEAIPFDMFALLGLVANINPDLLCLDMTPEQWRAKDFVRLPPEYREALLPLASQTDIVIAPIGTQKPPPDNVVGGWRRVVLNWLRIWIAAIQRTSSGPDATNQGWRHDLVNYLYDAIRLLSGRELKRKVHDHTDRLTLEVLAVSRNDPGVRMLVVVNVQYCHILCKKLERHDQVEVTNYTDL